MQRHGLSIGIERINQHFFIMFKVVGKLTHADYEVITPMLDRALEGIPEPAVHALLDCTELEGWEMRAAWDDFKLGLKHHKDFSKVAIVGNKKWLELSAKVSAWFVSGDIQYFEDCDEAVSWLTS